MRYENHEGKGILKPTRDMQVGQTWLITLKENQGEAEGKYGPQRKLWVSVNRQDGQGEWDATYYASLTNGAPTDRLGQALEKAERTGAAVALTLSYDPKTAKVYTGCQLLGGTEPQPQTPQVTPQVPRIVQPPAQPRANRDESIERQVAAKDATAIVIARLAGKAASFAQVKMLWRSWAEHEANWIAGRDNGDEPEPQPAPKVDPPAAKSEDDDDSEFWHGKEPPAKPEKQEQDFAPEGMSYSAPEPEPEPEPAPPPKRTKAAKITANQQVALLALYSDIGYSPDAMRRDVQKWSGVPLDKLTADQYEELKAVLTKRRGAAGLETEKGPDEIPF